MDGNCQGLSEYLNSSQYLTKTAGSKMALFMGLIYSLIGANLRLGNPNNYPPDSSSHLLKEYDFIVIGAGAAGSVVANRLSEVKDWKVLLVEAGGDPPPTADIPGIYFTLQNTEVDWQYRTYPNKNSCLGLKNPKKPPINPKKTPKIPKNIPIKHTKTSHKNLPKKTSQENLPKNLPKIAK